MTVRITCQSCGQAYKVAAEKGPKRFRCKKCGRIVDVGMSDADSSPPSDVISRPDLIASIAAPAPAPPRPNPEPAVVPPTRRTWLYVAAAIVGCAIAASVVLFIVFFGSRPAGNSSAEPTNVAAGESSAQGKSTPPPSVAELPPSSDFRPGTAQEPDLRTALKPVGTKPPELQSLVATVEPSVVKIHTTFDSGGGIGSGFVVDARGIVATNYHVIEGARSVSVVLSDGQHLRTLGFVAISPGKDLALLQVDPPRGKPLRALSLVDGRPTKAESVLAFGSPLGLGNTVSQGIISAIRSGRELQSLPGVKPPEGIVGNDSDAIWIQTTAPISPGNSGGPLVNRSGQVVGVNTRIRLGGQNLNFAVAASHLKALMQLDSQAVRSFGELPPSTRARRVVKAPPKTTSPTPYEKERLAQEQKRLAEEKRRFDEARKLAEKERRSREIQAELSRINSQGVTLRAEISQIESEGAALTAEQNRLNGLAQATYSQGQGINRQLVAINARLQFLSGAIQRRQTAVQYPRSPIFTDGDNTPYTAAGVASLQYEAATLASRRTSLQAEAQRLNSLYSGLIVKARGLNSQIQYKAEQRASRLAQLAELDAKYKALQAQLPD